ncbi:hypothetical protein ILYODFUR_022787 [Ilyodon furcidens]|uniref:Uncharacterized protein n=1 Tax=Ilyodon furcidens TaxID=33524 RepID=A0ABV0V6B9_9TELE
MCACCLIFPPGSVSVLTAELQEDPVRFPPHRPAEQTPAAGIEGSVPSSAPTLMQQSQGVYISPLLPAASTNHVAFYSSIITGFEGRKKRKAAFLVLCSPGSVSRMLSLFAGLKLLFGNWKLVLV